MTLKEYLKLLAQEDADEGEGFKTSLEDLKKIILEKVPELASQKPRFFRACYEIYEVHYNECRKEDQHD